MYMKAENCRSSLYAPLDAGRSPPRGIELAVKIQRPVYVEKPPEGLSLLHEKKKWRRYTPRRGYVPRQLHFFHECTKVAVYSCQQLLALYRVKGVVFDRPGGGDPY